MIVFPSEFVKLKYPGYFWNTQNKTLYSIKVGGYLRPLKKYPALKMMTNGIRLDRPAGYNLSVNGVRRFVSEHSLMGIAPKTETEVVDLKPVT